MRQRYGAGTARKTGEVFVALRAPSRTVIFGRSHKKSARKDGAQADGITGGESLGLGIMI
jgi:hypothetical protein